MPPVIIPAIATGLSVGLSVSITAGILAGVVTLALGAVSYALRPDLTPGSREELGAGLQISTTAAAQPRRILYGRNRVGGQIVMRSVTGEQSSAFHQVVVWSGHEVTAIETVYANDEIIPQTYGTLTGSDIYFEDIGDDIHSTTTVLDSVFGESGMVFQVSGATNNMNGLFRIKNTLVEDTRDNELNLVRLDGGPFNSTIPGASTITLTETYSRVNNHLGTEGAAADVDAITDIADWTSAHTLSGCAYSYVTLYYSQSHWKTGIPNLTAVIQGKQCFDPRDSTTKYTRNPALIIRDWLTDTTYGLGVPTANLNDASVITAANICDEDVTTTAGTVDRYTCDAVISANEDRRDVLHRLAASMAGYVVQTGATWTLKAGAYETPTLTFDESDLRGPIQIVPKRSRQELFNSVKAGYRDATLDWQPTDMPHVQDAGALAQDNAEEKWRALRYDYVTDRETVVRLAKIELLRSRQQLSVQMRVGLTGIEITAGDTIAITNARYGWSSKAFFVEKWSLAPYQDEHGEPAIGVDLVLRETAASVYTWASGEASPTPAPNTLPTPEWATMEAPSSFTLASGAAQLSLAGDGTVISRIKVTWALSDGAFASRFEVRYRRSAEIEWTNITTAEPTAWIAPVDDLSTYDVGVRAFNALGVPSAWTGTAGYTVIGKTGVPNDVATFTATAARDRILLAWSAVADRDLAHYEIREGASWAGASVLAKVKSTSYQSKEPSNGPWLIKAVDTSGNESATATSATITVSLPAVTSVTGQVVDNNVLLKWVATTGTFDLATFEIRKGDSFATAEAVGDSDKTFDVVFELAGGTYTYWIVPIDAAGNEGTESSITLAVAAPPDFVLYNNFQTDWEGFSSSNVQPQFSVPLPARLTTRDQTALTFDGVDDYVDMGDVVDLTGAFTVEIKAYPLGVGPIIAKDNGTDGWSLSIVDPGTVRFTHRDLNTVNTDSSANAIDDGRFVRLAAAFDPTANAVTLYIEGTQAGQSTGQTNAITGNAASLKLGADDAGSFAALRLAEVRIWNVTRTSTEINDWMDRTLDGNETNLAGYWRAQGGSGVTLSDKSGNGNDGAIVGASWHGPNVRALIPFPTAETVNDKSAVHLYTTPQAQIDAGFAYVAQPVPTTASFTEIYDSGAVIASTKVTATLAGSDIVAGVTSSVTLSTRKLETDPWTDHTAGLTSVFVTNFQYIKVTVDYTGDGAAFRDAQDINVVLSTKIINDSGKVTVSANPTSVTLNVAFVDIESITATPQGTTAKLAMVDFNDVANPTSFDIHLFDAAGVATTGDVRWSARGF